MNDKKRKGAGSKRIVFVDFEPELEAELKRKLVEVIYDTVSVDTKRKKPKPCPCGCSGRTKGRSKK